MKELLLLIPFRQRPQVTDFNPENTENQNGKNILKAKAHTSSFSRFLSAANFFGNRERRILMITHNIREPIRTKINKNTSTMAALTRNLIICDTSHQIFQIVEQEAASGIRKATDNAPLKVVKKLHGHVFFPFQLVPEPAQLAKQIVVNLKVHIQY